MAAVRVLRCDIADTGRGENLPVIGCLVCLLVCLTLLHGRLPMGRRDVFGRRTQATRRQDPGISGTSSRDEFSCVKPRTCSHGANRRRADVSSCSNAVADFRSTAIPSYISSLAVYVCLPCEIVNRDPAGVRPWCEGDDDLPNDIAPTKRAPAWTPGLYPSQGGDVRSRLATRSPTQVCTSSAIHATRHWPMPRHE